MSERFMSALSIVGAIILTLMLPLIYPICMVIEWRARRKCARIGHQPADEHFHEESTHREVYCMRCWRHYTLAPRQPSGNGGMA